jgi:hypothetical protein
MTYQCLERSRWAAYTLSFEAIEHVRVDHRQQHEITREQQQQGRNAECSLPSGEDKRAPLY